MAQNRISDPSGERGLFNTIDGLDTKIHTARGSATARDIATLAGGIIAGDQWFNTDTNILQIYSGSSWNNVYTPSPVITSVLPVSATGAQGVTITINGLNFGVTPTVYFVNGANGNKIAATGIQFVNTSTITVQTPALLASGSPYGVQVINLDATNGQTNSLLSVSAGTAWTTTAGALFNSYIGNAISYPLLATSSLPLTYSVVSGSLPNGLALTNGVLVGTLTTAGNFTFTIRITDTATNTVDRTFTASVAARPTITSFTPVNFGTPTGAQVVTITGTNLVNGSTVQFVSVGNSATVFNSAATSYSSSTSMTGTIPSNMDTTQSPYYVRISTPETGQYNATITSSTSFTISGAPIVTAPSGSFSSASLPLTVTTSGGSGAVTLSLTNNTANASLAGSSLNATQSGSVTIVATDAVGQQGTSVVTLSFGLYAFSSFTFDTCGATGSGGPNGGCSAQSQAWSAYFSVSAGYQYWYPPATGSYTIYAAGACGSSLTNSNTARGIIVARTVTLTQGQRYKMIVGQYGVSGGCGSGAGGGGTHFATDGNSPIISAGGGGGSNANSGNSGFAGGDGQFGDAGSGDNMGSSYGGSGGNGGSGSNNGWGYGGAGFYGGGGNSSNGGGSPGTSFTSGGYGGSSVNGSPGGFGGGGGVHGCNGGGGGGGGWSGGGGTNQNANYAQAGGGGSYPQGSISNQGYRINSGYITVVKNF